MIDFFVWFGLGFAVGHWIISFLKFERKLSEYGFATQMVALLLVLIGLFV